VPAAQSDAWQAEAYTPPKGKNFGTAVQIKLWNTKNQALPFSSNDLARLFHVPLFVKLF
jgi:hypothetical protein